MDPRRDVRRLHTGEEGITGLETAIILIAFVVVAAVFSFVLLGTGMFSADRSRETVLAGLAKTRGSMELSGSVIATSNGTEVTDVALDIALAAGGSAVNWDSTADNRVVVSYIDENQVESDLDYTATVITGDGDDVLEPGELFEISVTGLDTLLNLAENDTFVIQIQPPSGATMTIQRTLPGSIEDTVIDLN
jgi:flagellin FlaB